jgi:hypothetical protein
MTMKPRIYLIVDRPGGRQSEAENEGLRVTGPMLDAAEDLLHTLTTGERPVIKNLYDLVAKAFNTTHEDAKWRITAAAYGMSAEKIEQQRHVSPHDRRRLADGARALALPDSRNPDDIREQLEIIHVGMLALQSLDDLGEEGNRRAHEDLCELEKRYEKLQALLKTCDGTCEPMCAWCNARADEAAQDR